MRARAAALTLTLLFPLAARAQEGGAQLSAGYSYGHSEDESFHGWTAGVAFRLAGSLWLVGEVTGHYGTLEGGTELTRLWYLAGPRLTFGSGSARPFVQFLGGLVHSSAGIDVGPISIKANSDDAGGAAGAGLDLRLGGRWSARLQGDYTLVWADEETESGLRVSLQAVYRLGGS